MGYIVAIVLMIIVVLVAIFILAKNTGVMGGVIDGIRSALGIY